MFPSPGLFLLAISHPDTVCVRVFSQALWLVIVSCFEVLKVAQPQTVGPSEDGIIALWDTGNEGVDLVSHFQSKVEGLWSCRTPTAGTSRPLPQGCLHSPCLPCGHGLGLTSLQGTGVAVAHCLSPFLHHFSFSPCYVSCPVTSFFPWNSLSFDPWNHTEGISDLSPYTRT
jgi:hypothetical protein